MTDIEGSTRLLQRLGSDYAVALAQHHRLMRAAIREADGTEVSTEGDSFFAIFPDAPAGIRAAVSAQRALAAATWPQGATLSVRMGLHLGEVTLSESEYVGVELNRTARISAAAHGGQIVISAAVAEAARPTLPAEVSLRDLGEHRLKDFDRELRLYQVDIHGLRTDFPPLSSLTARFDLLPSELSSFIGREVELARIAELLESTRLLTLTGPGGTGKTRLALHAAHSCEAGYRHGAAFVPLASVTDPGLVATTIRSTLGFAEEPGVGSIETLTSRLRRHELLLVLDNFEQVTAAAETVGSLLAGTDALTIVVTSRVALHLDGESVLEVMPMPVPTADGSNPDDIVANDAVRLFVERARQADSGFELDFEAAAAVAAICRRLDGLPLAIELAAARVRMLAPTALSERLSKRLDVIDPAGERDDRRRTLRGTIDWSHDLLTSEEQAVFRRLAIFSGGGTLSSIEALVPRVDIPGTAVIHDVIGPLATLIDQSLLRYTRARPEARYLMLETLRDYASGRLAASGEADALAAAHARWFLGRVHALAPGFTAGPAGLDEIEADHANVRTALRWLISEQRTQDALSAVGDLWRFWHLRGHLREGLALCEEIIDLPGAAEASEASAAALYAHASLNYWQGGTADALEGYLRSRAVARTIGSVPHEAEAEFALAYAYAVRRDFDEGHRAAQRAVELYEQSGDGAGSANARFADAYLWSLAGQWETAREGLVAVISDVEASGDRFWTLNSRIVLAWTLTRLGQVDEARGILRGNLEGAIELGDRSMEHMAIHALATIAVLDGQTDVGLRLAGAAQRIADELGGKAPEELVVGLDPVELAEERGIAQATVEARLIEGLGLDSSEGRDLAFSVARATAP